PRCRMRTAGVHLAQARLAGRGDRGITPSLRDLSVSGRVVAPKPGYVPPVRRRPAARLVAGLVLPAPLDRSNDPGRAGSFLPGPGPGAGPLRGSCGRGCGPGDGAAGDRA